MPEVIFVSDMFAEEHSKGGAELTTEAIIDGAPQNTDISKILCRRLTAEDVGKHPDAFWIIGNFASLKDDVKFHIMKKAKYSIIEYDYKYCKFRSDDLHILSEGKCDCSSQQHGKLNSLFLAKSKCIWWMSEGQRNFYFNQFPFLKNTNNIVLNSVFDAETLQYFSSLDVESVIREKNNKWIIMNSPSWIKNVQGCVSYAKDNNLDYELLWNLSRNDFLKKLEESKGLIFLPSGKDTCPRLVMEARLLGCELVLNSNVQHKDEDWFQDRSKMLNHMFSRTEAFWSEISKYV